MIGSASNVYLSQSLPFSHFFFGLNSIGYIRCGIGTALGSATVQRLARWPRGWEARWPELARDLLGYRRLYRANRRHDAPDALTGVVETELDRSRRTIRAVGFRSPER